MYLNSRTFKPAASTASVKPIVTFLAALSAVQLLTMLFAPSVHAVNMAALVADQAGILYSVLSLLNNLTAPIKALVILIGFALMLVIFAFKKDVGAVGAYLMLGVLASAGLPIGISLSGAVI